MTSKIMYKYLLSSGKEECQAQRCLLENFPRLMREYNGRSVKQKLLARLDTEKENIFNTVQKRKRETEEEMDNSEN